MKYWVRGYVKDEGNIISVNGIPYTEYSVEEIEEINRKPQSGDAELILFEKIEGNNVFLRIVYAWDY